MAKAEQKERGYFSRDSLTWKINREAILLLGGGRALLMQVAHPLVAQGVYEHSDFQKDPVGRLLRTLNIMLDIVFGDRKEADRALAYIKKAHKKVKGKLPYRAGKFSANTPYYAEDPDLMFWVYATLFDTALYLYELFVQRLSEKEKEALYQEGFQMLHLLEIPKDGFPRNYKAFQKYLADMLNSDAIVVTPEGERIAKAILYPPLPYLEHALFFPQRIITIGLLPPVLRKKYEFEWGYREEILFRAFLSGMRLLLRALPEPLRVIPQARRAEQKLT